MSMYQNNNGGGGGGGMAQFGQMGLNQFSQQAYGGGGGGGGGNGGVPGGMMVPMMMPPGQYGYPPPGMMFMGPPQPQQQQQQQNSYINEQDDSVMLSQSISSQDGMKGGAAAAAPQQYQRGRASISRSQASLPMSKPSEGFTAGQDRYDRSSKSKEYARQLDYQLRLKQQKKDEMKNIDQLEIERLRQDRQRKQALQFQGQIIRDANGNIISSKLNPSNPNHQAQDWFSHVAHKDEGIDMHQRLGHTSSISAFPQAAPDLAMFDLDLKRQRELEQRLQTSKTQHGNQDRIQRAQDAFQQNSSSIGQYQQQNVNQSQYFSKPQNVFGGGENDALKMRKRQEAQDLQREQMEQMEEKKRQKELKTLQEKRERELEDLKIERERQEIEMRMLSEFQNAKGGGKKNLLQTNFDTQSLSIDMTSSSNPPTLPKSALKKRSVMTPPDDDAFNSSGMRVEQRIVRELPIEITTTVKETMHNELQRLRNEMNLHQNSLGEQILGMKSQLMKANERRFQAEDDVRRLKEEVKKTQIIDEIRQRELYNAFVLTDKPKIHSNNTDKLYEQGKDFQLPTRPRPYYNMQDPYLDNYNDGFEKDNHGVLVDQSKHIPVGEYDYTANPVQDKRSIEEHFFHDRDEQRELARQAVHVETNTLFDLPDDYLNRQNLFYGKKAVNDDDTREDVFDYKEVIAKNQVRLDRLDEIDVMENKGQFDKMEEALFDLAKHSQQESRYSKRYDMEDNLQDIEQFVSFQNRLSRYG